MKNLSKYDSVLIITLLLFHVFSFKSSFAQKAIVINKEVGVLIDSIENFRYLTFTDYSFENFIAAQVFEYPDKQYELRIYLKDDEVINKAISQKEIEQLSSKIRFCQNGFVKGDTLSYYSISLNDGTILNGKILSFTNNKINLISPNLDNVNILTKSVIEIKNLKITKLKADMFYENQHSSRYFYAPSAIPMEKGEGYFQDIYLLFISGNYAVSNHTTIGGGFSIIPGIGIDNQAYFINAKVAYQITEKFYLGGGGLLFGVENSSIGLGYAIGTYGSKDHNATLGIGYGYFDDELMETPVFTLCGMTRVSKRISLMTENWFGNVIYDDENCYEISPGNYYCEDKEVTEFHWLFCYGLRFFSNKISVDLGFMNAPTGEELFFPGIPYLDFVVRF